MFTHLLLIVAFLTVQWSSQHIHLSAPHDHDSGAHQHQTTLHAHFAASHHADNIDMAESGHDHDAVDVALDLQQNGSSPLKNLPAVAAVSPLLLALPAERDRYTTARRVDPGRDYLSYSTVRSRAPPAQA